MQALKRGEFTRIITLIKQRKSKVKQSGLWRSLCADLGIGESSADGRWVIFTADDREILRSTIRKQAGFDPLVDSLPDAESVDRLMMAGAIDQEKYARAAVGKERLLLTVPHGDLLVDGRAYTVPPQTALWVDWRTVKLAADQALIIVENKAAFIHWNRSKLPVELKSAVAVYRGDKLEARALINWLKTLPADRVVGAYDFDPAGLAMAREQGVGSILVPSEPDRFLEQRGGALHKQSAFADQHRQHESNRQWASGEVQVLWRWMDINGSSITQETMLEAGETLRLVRF